MVDDPNFADLPKEMMYLNCRVDPDNRPFDGANKNERRFEERAGSGGSITIYIQDKNPGLEKRLKELKPRLRECFEKSFWQLPPNCMISAGAADHRFGSVGFHF